MLALPPGCAPPSPPRRHRRLIVPAGCSQPAEGRSSGRGRSIPAAVRGLRRGGPTDRFRGQSTPPRVWARPGLAELTTWLVSLSRRQWAHSPKRLIRNRAASIWDGPFAGPLRIPRRSCVSAGVSGSRLHVRQTDPRGRPSRCVAEGERVVSACWSDTEAEATGRHVDRRVVPRPPCRVRGRRNTARSSMAPIPLRVARTRQK